MNYYYIFEKYIIIDYNVRSCRNKNTLSKEQVMFNESINKCISTKKKILGYFLIAFLIALTDFFVYSDGGSQSIFSHVMYFPILLAALIGEMKLSFMTALIGGITLGPLMYRDVSTQTSQEPREWVFRLLIFVIIAIVFGFLVQQIKQYEMKEMDQFFFNDAIGLANANQLKVDLSKRIEMKEPFSLIAFQISNMDHINRYVDYRVGEKSLKKVIQMFLDFENLELVYFICSNEFAVILPKRNVKDTYELALKFLQRLIEPISINGFLIEIIMKAGIVHCPSHSCHPDELFRKMELALDEAHDSLEPYIYDEETERKNKEKYEIRLSLHDAIPNEQLFLVYQPKVSLKEKKIIGVEALLRWKHPKKGFINPEKFIAIAENVGLINEITKWVIQNTIQQLTLWQKEGILVNLAINFSPKDMKNSNLVNFLKQSVERYKINSQWIELEITERGIIKNMDFVKTLLNDARSCGFTISMDDFGTGYNSLLNLIQLPIDYIKIDKLFIDQIKDDEDPIELKNIIQMAHRLGIQVIAEGVENRNQLEWLKENECDYIQGYYFSEPLLPNDLVKFIKNFPINLG